MSNCICHTIVGKHYECPSHPTVPLVDKMGAISIEIQYNPIRLREITEKLKENQNEKV